jgi:tRNA(Arg) A34 adenosine deaminase TadA/glycerol-3-phosphate cytidylyltransferase-like family protein
MKKIVTLNQIKKILPPNTAIIISGSFEPFNGYYFRLLQWGAKQGHPFIVIIQKDDMVFKRRGFEPLSSTHKTRAEIISSLEFVDYVIVANKTAHDRKCIEIINPKTIVFQKDNIKYRRILAREIRKNYPGIRIAQAYFDKNDILAEVSNGVLINEMTKPIAKALIKHSIRSRGKLSRISALLVDRDKKIRLITENNELEDHAEMLLLKKANKISLDLNKYAIHVLIPPCLMCAKAIAESQIKKVYYLMPYGDNAGLRFLKQKGIQVGLSQG